MTTKSKWWLCPTRIPRIGPSPYLRSGSSAAHAFTEAAISELQQTWARDDYAEWGALHAAVIPSYFAATDLALRSAAEATGADGADAEVKWAEAQRSNA